MKRDPEIRVPLKFCQPILVAQELYAKYSKIPFAIDLVDYVYTGCVVARPTCFAMAKVIDLATYENGVRIGEPDPAWFIRCAVGEIHELLSLLPCSFPKICFCRRKDETMRVYDMQRFMRLALRRKNGRIG